MTTTSRPAPFASAGHGPNARIGVLLCHGFTGSPASIEDWALHLSRHGYAVRVPLLPGHGTTWQDLARTRWQQWYAEVERTYLALAEDTDMVVAAGLSMGGTLALYLAEHHPVSGLLLVNPALTFYDRRAAFAGILKYFTKSVEPIGNSIRRPGVDEMSYERTPVAGVAQLHQLFRHTKAGLHRITAPALVFRSAEDDVVPETSMTELQARIGSSDLEVIPLPNSLHVATMDYDAPLIFRHSADFIQRVTGVDDGTS